MAKQKSKKASALRCPTCGTLVLRQGEDFPFCSDRCRIVDLGKWASGAYRISSPIVDPEVLEGLDEMHRRERSSGDDE
ncbi:MAG TPA: DNA gyrase inhibitor YacG [Acidobacteriaceae bacterium]|nr:DNA gyrase inhibitor YacG [Acidobacteriaceae bacterium]